MALAPRVLLADADASLMRTLAWMLKQNGYAVQTAASLDDAQSSLLADEFDLLVLDLELVRGQELLVGALRADPALVGLAVLCLASTAPDPAVIAALGVSSDDVILKPFPVRDLLSRMMQALRAQRMAAGAAVSAKVRSEISAIFGQIEGAQGFDELCRVLVRGVARALGVPRVSIVLARRGDTHGVVVAASENPTLKDLRVDLTRYPEIRAALEGDDPVLVSDVGTDPLYDPVRDLWKFDALRVDTVSAIAMRFQLGQTTSGVFFIRTSNARTPLTDADARFAERVLTAGVVTLEEAMAREAESREKAHEA